MKDEEENIDLPCTTCMGTGVIKTTTKLTLVSYLKSYIKWIFAFFVIGLSLIYFLGKTGFGLTALLIAISMWFIGEFGFIELMPFLSLSRLVEKPCPVCKK